MPNPPAPPAGGNILTRHSIIPAAPNWVVAGGVAAVLVGVAYWRNRQASASSQQGAQDTSTPADQVPDYIFQNYVTANTPVTVQTGTPAGVTPPVVPPRGGTPIPAGPGIPITKGKTSAQVYRVKHGDTLSSIAKKNGTTWQALWAYNTDPKNRDKQAIATLKARGPNLLVANEEILIPPKR